MNPLPFARHCNLVAYTGCVDQCALVVKQLHWWQEESVEVGEPVLDDADQRAGTLVRCHRRLRRLLGIDERQSTANGKVADRHLVLLLVGGHLAERSESQKPRVVARGLQVLLLAKELCARVGAIGGFRQRRDLGSGSAANQELARLSSQNDVSTWFCTPVDCWSSCASAARHSMRAPTVEREAL